MVSVGVVCVAKVTASCFTRLVQLHRCLGLVQRLYNGVEAIESAQARIFGDRGSCDLKFGLNT